MKSIEWEEILYGGEGAVDTEQGQEKINSLSVFLTQMAIYRFSTMYFPKILANSGVGLDKTKVSKVVNNLERWEEGFWLGGINSQSCWTYAVDGIFRRSGLFEKREGCRAQYYCFDYNESVEYSNMLRCINRAFEEDEETVQAVKEVQLGSFSNFHSKEENNLKETQSIKHLIDIMDRDIKGELTEQDKIELRENAQNYSHDIESLMEMIKRVSR